MDNDWIYCPVCRNKTRIQIREETIMKCFPLFCPKCKHTFLVSVRDKRIREVEEIHK